MRPARALLAAGGTGGHLFPAQSLAEVLLGWGWEVRLSTDDRGARYVGGFPQEVEIERVSSATFARGGWGARLRVPFSIGAGVLQAVRRMRAWRPDVVVGFGGYPAVPAMAAAGLMRIPRLIHEQNGVLGRVNQAFVKRVDAVACGTWPTDLPDGVSAYHVGNPVRAAVLSRAGAAYIPPGDYPMSLLVIGGSQGAKILSDVVPEALGLLPEALRANLRVSHQARIDDVPWVREAYDIHAIDAEVRTFFEDVPARMAEAQLVISRAGASSLADITAIGRPSILVPLAAAIRDEQTANARALVEAEAAVLIPEARLTAKNLAANVEAILSFPEAADTMAARALELGRPHAAEDLANLAHKVAGMDKTAAVEAGEP